MQTGIKQPLPKRFEYVFLRVSALAGAVRFANSWIVFPSYARLTPGIQKHRGAGWDWLMESHVLVLAPLKSTMILSRVCYYPVHSGGILAIFMKQLPPLNVFPATLNEWARNVRFREQKVRRETEV